MSKLLELKKEYERELRREYRPEKRLEKKPFFDKFGYRSAEKEDKKHKSEALRKYTEFVEKEKKLNRKILDLIEDRIAYEEFFLRHEREKSRQISRSGARCSTENTRYHIKRIKKLMDEKEEMIKSSPEGFMVYKEEVLLKDLSQSTKGRLIDVPYVLRHRNTIARALDSGKPVYIVGHLGSGKTQLAEEAAIDFRISQKVQEDMEEYMEKMYMDNLISDSEDAFLLFREKYRERRKYYYDALNGDDLKLSEQLRPLFISGSHNLTYEDMFVEKSLKLAKGLDDLTYEDYLNRMITDFIKWMESNRDEIETLSEEEQLQLKIQTWQSFSNLFVAANSNFGTVVEKIDREILIALKQGRPVIIDELNTIAMQNLISLNDILQRSVGSKAYVTGVGPVEIKPGFCLIGTGNLSSDTVNYEGTNALNPAFQSRFITVEYNYMPQNTAGTFKEQKNPESNQLFRVIIEYLCDKNGYLTLPEPEKTLDELFRFAQFARNTQDIFEGRSAEEFKGESVHEGPVLNEAVLSIRNIIYVLDHWNYGEEESLTMAIWEGFLSCVTNSDDLNFLLVLALKYGFFTESEGFEFKARLKGSPSYTLDEIMKESVKYSSGEYRVLSSEDVVHILFGNGPKRKCIPKELADIAELEEKKHIDYNMYEDINQKISHMEHTSDILRYIEKNDVKDI